MNASGHPLSPDYSRRERHALSFNVYVSSSLRDAWFVEKLYDTLDGRVHGLWIDHDQLTDDGTVSEANQHYIDTCDCMILVLSPNAVQSAFVASEYTRALDQDTPIIPILIRSCEIPPALRQLTIIDGAHTSYARTAVQLWWALERLEDNRWNYLPSEIEYRARAVWETFQKNVADIVQQWVSPTHPSGDPDDQTSVVLLLNEVTLPQTRLLNALYHEDLAALTDEQRTYLKELRHIITVQAKMLLKMTYGTAPEA